MGYPRGCPRASSDAGRNALRTDAQTIGMLPVVVDHETHDIVSGGRRQLGGVHSRDHRSFVDYCDLSASTAFRGSAPTSSASTTMVPGSDRKARQRGARLRAAERCRCACWCLSSSAPRTAPAGQASRLLVALRRRPLGVERGGAENPFCRAGRASESNETRDLEFYGLLQKATPRRLCCANQRCG